QGVHGGQPTVMVLVEFEEGLGGQRTAEPLSGKGFEHAGLADRMLVVVLPNASRRALKHCRGYGKSKPVSSHLSAREDHGYRKLPPGIVSLLKALPKKTTPMEVLRTGISALSAYDPDAADNSKDATARKALRLTAQMPTLVAAWERIRRGKAPVAPNPKLNLAANFLCMLTGKKASPLAVKTFDVALILHADHEFNASTFAARVTAATMSDLHSAIVSAIGALKGPLHGGANEQVMLMVQKIKTPPNADAWIRKTLAD